MGDETARAGDPPGFIITRRGLLRGLGLVLLESQLTSCQVLAPLTKTRSFDVIRPEDRLWLHFDLYNLDLDPAAPSGEPRLIRKDSGEAYLVVVFPPQSVGEEAQPGKLEVDGTEGPDGQTPARAAGFQARLAGESRLAFRVPDAVTSIPYTLEALLDWSVLEPSLVPVTSGPTLLGGAPTIRAPLVTESALELPWWLVLSPETDSRWAHALAPVTHNGRTELWHTRLGRAGANGVDESGSPGVRAVWAMDPDMASWLRGASSPSPKPKEGVERGYPFVMSAKPVDRLNVVRNSSDWSRVGGATSWQWKAVGYKPSPFTARALHLTALGATADLDGQWDPPTELGSSLIAWAHRMFGGRDSTVRVVNRGYLYPWGHRAVQIELTERKFLTIDGARTACLLKRTFLVVNERRRTYEGARGVPNEARAFPFREVQVITRQTPDVIGKLDVGTVAYQPLLEGSAPMMLDCVGTDWAGRRTAFKAPFVFYFGETGAFNANVMGAFADLFAALPLANRTATVGGARVAFAKEDKPDDTTLELHDFIVGAQKVVDQVQESVLKAASQVAGFPEMVEATVKQSAMQAVAGANDLTSKLKFPLEYLQEGFGSKNPGGVFLQYAQQQVLKAATDATGGLLTPNQALTAVTRALGPIGGQLQDAIDNKFNPEEIFKQFGPDQFGKLLGGVPLKEIFKVVEGVKGRLDEALKWVEQHQPTEIVASFKWKPKEMKPDDFGIFLPDQMGPSSAVFEGEFRQSLKDPNARSAKASGELTNFALLLVGGTAPFLRLDIGAVRFRTGTGKKTELDVALTKISFTGALAFVETLRPFLEALGQGPSSLPIPKGIEVTAGLQIPKVQMGVFQLANLGFDAKLVVPFTGEPVRFRFRFATKENPFTLSVAIFGGTGYFALGVGGDGVELVEIAFEFGGMLALDVGVASGSIKAVAGVYLKFERQMNKNRVELTGYLKLTGQLSVLGIVSVSILLDLSFQYLHKELPDGNLDIITGRAKCEIKVTIVFFTISVGFEVEKSFGGNPADPTVADQFTEPNWLEYAAAFA